MADLCSCGSGRAFVRCHGDPRNTFAREQALAEALQLPLLFPSVRLRSPRLRDFAECAAREVGAGKIPDELLDRGFALVGAPERRELVAGWATDYPDRWESLSRTAADDVAAQAQVVRGAVLVAIHERLPTPVELLVELEVSEPPPLQALALVVPPQFVWSIDEARAAAPAHPSRVEDVATPLGRLVHVERLRALVERVRREIPFRGFPYASDAVAVACDRAASDAAGARTVLALLLLAYAHELEPSYITSLN